MSFKKADHLSHDLIFMKKEIEILYIRIDLLVGQYLNLLFMCVECLALN